MCVKKNALVGYSGFVGQTLLKQARFDSCYRSTNINDIRGGAFDMVVCAGAPAVKWLANKEPEIDKSSIDSLIDNLSEVECRQFVLISTVDVYKNSLGATESTEVDADGLHPYGLHRFQLEEFVRTNFENHLIVRLPGLVGPGLKKNIIYDLLHGNEIDKIDSRGVFQFYPMVNLWPDIVVAMKANLKLIHLTSEPISVEAIAKECFGMEFNQSVVKDYANYDFRSEFAKYYSSDTQYQYSKKEVILAIRAFVQSELYGA